MDQHQKGGKMHQYFMVAASKASVPFEREHGKKYHWLGNCVDIHYKETFIKHIIFHCDIEIKGAKQLLVCEFTKYWLCNIQFYKWTDWK